MFRFLLLAAVALQLCAEVRQYRSEHFQLDIPAGWKDIPKEELLQMAKSLRAAAPDAEAQSYDYGFRPEGAAAHVRVVVQVKHERWSEEFFDQTSKLMRAKGLIQHGITAGSPALAELQPKIGEMRWDPDQQVLWMRTEIKDPDTQVLAGVHLTREGSVQVLCAAGAADYAKLADTFAGVIQSVKVDDDFRYVPRSDFRLFFADYGWMAITALGFACTLGAGLLWRKQQAR